MITYRLAWEPENTTPLADIEARLMQYTRGRGGITMLANGTLLTLLATDDPAVAAQGAIEAAREFRDFQVVTLPEGGYMVTFHPAVAVFVGQDEFDGQRAAIEARIADLYYPGERITVGATAPTDQRLIGLYARGKLQRDAWHFAFHKRL